MGLSLLLPLLCVGLPAKASRGAGANLPGKQTVPLSTVEFAGRRYVATAEFGKSGAVPLMIHGNARVFLSLTHEAAESLTGGPVPKLEDYGYTARGKGTIDIPMMRLGGRRFTNLRRVPVFDFSDEAGTPVRGMVGVPFLVKAGAAVDFSRDELIFGVRTARSPSRKLLGEGYRWVRLGIGASNRVMMQAHFPGLDSTLTITPSTVASALTLHLPVFAGRLPVRREADTRDRSPSGTSPDVFTSEGVEFEIAGVRFNSPATLEDFAEYADVPEAELESVGFLGFDWMKEHEAIIDYANHMLYFKP